MITDDKKQITTLPLPDHAMLLARAVYSIMITDPVGGMGRYSSRTFQTETPEYRFEQVLAACRQMIGGLSTTANAITALNIEAKMVGLPLPILISYPKPNTVRECLKAAWKAMRRGRW